MQVVEGLSRLQCHSKPLLPAQPGSSCSLQVLSQGAVGYIVEHQHSHLLLQAAAQEPHQVSVIHLGQDPHLVQELVPQRHQSSPFLILHGCNQICVLQMLLGPWPAWAPKQHST